MHQHQNLKSGFTITELLICVAIIGIILGIGVPAILASRDKSQQTTCMSNLLAINIAKRGWATDNLKPETAQPTSADLIGPTKYMKSMPECPTGGTYTFRQIWQRPQCSIDNHTI